MIDLCSYSFLRAVHNPSELSIAVVRPAVRCSVDVECTIDFAHRLYVWTRNRIVRIDFRMQKVFFFFLPYLLP